MQFLLHIFSQRWKKKSIASCRRHLRRYKVQLQLKMVSKNTLQSQAATCNGFKRSLQLLQKVEISFTACVTWCKFFSNLCHNGVARQVAVKLKTSVTRCRFSCNLSRNGGARQVPGRSQNLR